MDRTNLVKLILDYCHNNVQKYSQAEAKETIFNAIKELNGGSTKLSRKTFRRGTAIFDLIEEVIQKEVTEGLEANDFYNALVETRNMAEGDAPEFVVKADSNLVVADVAKGTRGLRRQRIGSERTFTLTPVTHGIKVYEEMARVLAGRADISELVSAVSEAMTKRMLDDVYAAFSGITASVMDADYYPTAGTYDEDTLLDLCNHVSAANGGAKVMLVCTLRGARKIKASDGSEISKESVYNNGYATKWNGIDVQVVPQHHKVGTNEFIFDDNKIYVLPVNMDKPIKQVISGEVILEVGTGAENADMSYDILMLSDWATMVVVGKKFGIYELA